MSASDRTPVGDPGSDPTADSELGLPRTYGRTHGDEVVKTDISPTFRNARDGGKAIVTQGNAADLLLPDATVDLVVTSPPYFGLRSYQDGGEHYDGQIGDEATPTEYLDALIECTREWMRVLKPGGSIFVNLGDKYAGVGGPNNSGAAVGETARKVARSQNKLYAAGVRKGAPAKSLFGLPWRYAIRCIDELGLILRAEIVWSKPNGLPESVTDRVRRSHEQVFHFVKQPRYYSAVDEVREGYAPGTAARYLSGYKRTDVSAIGQTANGVLRADNGGPDGTNPLGKLPGSVWTIPTAPLKVPASLGIDHFAAYPPELVRRIVLGWSPREVCTACGEGRRPVSEVERGGPDGKERRDSKRGLEWAPARGVNRLPGVWSVTGYACACPDTDAPATPGVVLDPFGGTGTTALVATMHDRVGISVDLSADYCRLAQWRTTDPGERARVLGVEKPPVQVDGQIDMFGEWTA